MAEKEITLKVDRYEPEASRPPYLQTYAVPVKEGMVVLDALNHVRDEQDPSLAYRWSCRMGICGSCGMMVNGKPTLTCEEPVQEHEGKELHVSPLDHFPVIRDLVVDLSDFMEKLQAVQPWVIRDEEKRASEGEHRQTPEERLAYATHSACINCMLCYAACPVYGLNPQFVGPAALALAYRYNMDSRDRGEALRRSALDSPDAVWGCTFVGECSVVCPKHVLPA